MQIIMQLAQLSGRGHTFRYDIMTEWDTDTCAQFVHMCQYPTPSSRYDLHPHALSA